MTATAIGPPWVFYLVRDEDVSGISGVGLVAEGMISTDGKVVLVWRSDNAAGVCSVNVHDNLTNAWKIHGHSGKTRFVFRDALPTGLELPFGFVCEHTDNVVIIEH